MKESFSVRVITMSRDIEGSVFRLSSYRKDWLGCRCIEPSTFAYDPCYARALESAGMKRTTR